MEDRKWEDLPKDCLTAVFQRLGFMTLLRIIPHVCSSWYKVSRESQLWRHIDFSNVEASSNQIKYVVDLSCATAVDFKFPHSCSVKELEYVSERCPLLKYVKLPDVIRGPCQAKEVWKPVGKWKYLEHLELRSNFWFDDMTMVLGRHCKKLKSLTISGKLSKEETRSINLWVPGIKNLRVTEGSLIEWNCIRSITECCKALEEVDVTNCIVVEYKLISGIRRNVLKEKSLIRPNVLIKIEGFRIVESIMASQAIEEALLYPALEG